ncbi:GNAT family N-acetyltransferase [Streptomyces capparidis]
MHTITRLSADGLHDSVKSLADLLVDAVGGGASLGFTDPFDHEAAAAWWRARHGAVAGGALAVWAAHGRGGEVTGTVSLAFEDKPNGRHRAEVLKLMVRSDARGAGLGRALLAAAEAEAARAGRTLLLLDTETGSAAEHLYRAAGWTPYGLVPDYASGPDGAVLKDCTFFYKRLAPRG